MSLYSLSGHFGMSIHISKFQNMSKFQNISKFQNWFIDFFKSPPYLLIYFHLYLIIYLPSFRVGSSEPSLTLLFRHKGKGELFCEMWSANISVYPTIVNWSFYLICHSILFVNLAGETIYCYLSVAWNHSGRLNLSQLTMSQLS